MTRKYREIDYISAYQSIFWATQQKVAKRIIINTWRNREFVVLMPNILMNGASWSNTIESVGSIV